MHDEAYVDRKTKVEAQEEEIATSQERAFARTYLEMVVNSEIEDRLVEVSDADSMLKRFDKLPNYTIKANAKKYEKYISDKEE